MSENAEITLTFGQTVLVAIIGFFGTVTVGVITYFGGRGTVAAQVQTAINASFKEMVSADQLRRAEDQKEIGELRGQVAGLEQHIRSLENILRNHGIDVPRQPLTQTVFVHSPSEGKTDA